MTLSELRDYLDHFTATVDSDTEVKIRVDGVTLDVEDVVVTSRRVIRQYTNDQTVSTLILTTDSE